MKEYKDSSIGVKLDIDEKENNIGDNVINISLYAYDIVLFALNEPDLQCLLNIVELWCEKWRPSWG